MRKGDSGGLVVGGKSANLGQHGGEIDVQVKAI
jgi:hypothetical protein